MKKWLRPWHFDLQGVGVIFQRFLYIENKFVYPCQRGCGGILVSPWLFVCLSVHTSVRLWKSGFCTITPLSFDMMITSHTYVILDTSKLYDVPLGFVTHPTHHPPLSWFWSKGQRSNFELKLFYHFHTAVPFHLAYNNDSSQIYLPWPEKDLIFYKYTYTPYQWSLYIVTTRRAEIHVCSF